MAKMCSRRKRSSLALPRPQRRPSQGRDNGEEVFILQISAIIVTAGTCSRFTMLSILLTQLVLVLTQLVLILVLGLTTLTGREAAEAALVGSSLQAISLAGLSIILQY